jgi:hypothetical protein
MMPLINTNNNRSEMREIKNVLRSISEELREIKKELKDLREQTKKVDYVNLESGKRKEDIDDCIEAMCNIKF